MAAKLLNSNPYLRDPAARREALRVTAATSSAVEGIRRPFANDKGKLKAKSPKTEKSAG